LDPHSQLPGEIHVVTAALRAHRRVPQQTWDVVMTIVRVVRRRLGFPVMLAGLALALLVWGGAVALVSFSVSAG